MKNAIPAINLYNHSFDHVVNIRPTVECEVSILKESEVEKLHEVWRVNLGEMKERLVRGDQCFICSVAGTIAHYCWVKFTGGHYLYEIGQTINIKPGHIWLYHARTADWAKGKGIYPFMLSQIVETYRNNEYRRAWGHVSPANIASEKGLLAAGFVFYKQVKSLHIGRFYIPLVRYE
jgi:hypothetical protein